MIKEKIKAVLEKHSVSDLADGQRIPAHHFERLSEDMKKLFDGFYYPED